MKKKGLFFTCLLLAVTMLLVFCGCSSYGGVKSAFEKEGYKEVTASETVKKLYEDSDEYKQISRAVKLHILQKESTGEGLDFLNALDVAVIAEFNSTEEMEDALKSHVTAEDAKNVYDELQKLDVVSGNCFLLYATPGTKCAEIFKGTK